MSQLLLLPEDDPSRVLRRTRDAGEIAAALEARGVRFEQWQAGHELQRDAGQDEVIRTYRADIDRLMRSCGYRSVDVVRLHPDDADKEWPAKAEAARKKFLEEHTHAEDEVRFFVEGAGLFYLRLDGVVHCVLCERGDLLGVPAGTRHWFDMGTRPSFTAIRLFTSPEGWVASFTGDPIARRFPSFDDIAGGDR